MADILVKLALFLFASSMLAISIVSIGIAIECGHVNSVSGGSLNYPTTIFILFSLVTGSSVYPLFKRAVTW